MTTRLLLEEYERRERAKAGVSHKRDEILSELFSNQKRFAEDPSRWKAVLGSRRAGKTEMWARIATVKALENPRALIRIWSVARLRAKELLWANFRWLHARHGIKVETNETELSITFENGAIIRLVGADKDKEAQKKRGDKTVFEVILEVQSFGPFIRSLVEDVIEPSLLDARGTICLEGTPGPLCTGYWWEVTGGEDVKATWESKSGWSVHRWTMLDNPHIPHAREEVERFKKQKRWNDDNPTYLREWCGRWVNDLTALFYSFDLLRNTYDTGKVQPWGKGWHHTLGWDLGFRDDMALTTFGWHDEYPDLYEVFSWKKPGALASEVMEKIEREEQEKSLRFVKQVADTGGGGRMYVEEVMSRYSRKFEAAKKTEKYEHVRLMNDDLLVGRVKLISGSPLQLEMAALMRDPDWPDPEKPEAPPREDPRCPNHCSDSALYAYRAAWHYFKPERPKAQPHVSTEAWVQQWVEQKASNRQRERNWVDRLSERADFGYGADD